MITRCNFYTIESWNRFQIDEPHFVSNDCSDEVNKVIKNEVVCGGGRLDEDLGLGGGGSKEIRAAGARAKVFTV